MRQSNLLERLISDLKLILDFNLSKGVSCVVLGDALAENDAYSVGELKDLGSGKPALMEITRLYHEAFADYGTHAL